MIISPKIKNRRNTISYTVAKAGAVFMFDGSGTGLWIKCGPGDDNQTAVNLETGELTTDNCNSAITLVDATLNWKHVPKTNTK